MQTLMDRIETYWNKRAESYSAGLFAPETVEKWQRFLSGQLPKPAFRKVLDIGTGHGFFAVVLSREGYDVTAVDYSSGMLAKAQDNASAWNVDPCFLRMNAQDLDFPDDTFDAAVTRNLTWNLENPKEAYAEWLRILRPGGILLNFDSSWYEYLFSKEMSERYLQDRKNTAAAGLIDGSVSYSDSPVMEEISRELVFSRMHRPDADLEMIKRCGSSQVTVDLDVWKELWDEEEKVMYASTPMFLIKVIK